MKRLSKHANYATINYSTSGGFSDPPSLNFLRLRGVEMDQKKSCLNCKNNWLIVGKNSSPGACYGCSNNSNFKSNLEVEK